MNCGEACCKRNWPWPEQQWRSPGPIRPPRRRTRRTLRGAQQYGAIFDNHHSDLAGLYARLGQARCWKELGQTDAAMAGFVEMLTQPDEPEALALLENETTLAALETSLLPAVRKQRERLRFTRPGRRRRRPRGNRPTRRSRPSVILRAKRPCNTRGASARRPGASGLAARMSAHGRGGVCRRGRLTGPYQAKAKARLSDPLLGARRRSSRRQPRLPTPATAPRPPWNGLPWPKTKRSRSRGGRRARSLSSPGGRRSAPCALRWNCATTTYRWKTSFRCTTSWRISYKGGNLREAAELGRRRCPAGSRPSEGAAGRRGGNGRRRFAFQPGRQ